eukprot:gene7073-8895_t
MCARGRLPPPDRSEPPLRASDTRPAVRRRDAEREAGRVAGRQQ